MQYQLLRDLAIIFAGSLLVILVFHRLKLPALPGFIVAGVLLGPNALGLVSDVHQVESLAEVGVILLLFTIGIEFSLSRLREMGRQVIIGGGAQVLLTVGLAAALAAGLGLAWRVAVLVGFLVALSSTAIVLKGLADKGEIDTPHGRLATGVLIGGAAASAAGGGEAYCWQYCCDNATVLIVTVAPQHRINSENLGTLGIIWRVRTHSNA